MKQHLYQVALQWTGNSGKGTANYRDYERSYEIQVEGKPIILGSSDPTFRGDKNKYNPEELLIAALSSCHMLWYLHLCADTGIVVLDYCDRATGKMSEANHGGGKFTEVMLQPIVLISEARNVELAQQLHENAHNLCFIANSVNFPVLCQCSIEIKASR